MRVPGLLLALVAACGSDTAALPGPPDAAAELPGSCFTSVSVALDDEFVCGTHADGTLLCWGKNDVGQLGRPADDEDHPRPEPVEGIAGATRAFTAHQGSCALLTDGTVSCWGAMGRRSLGTDVFDVAVGGGVACVVDDLATVCWGEPEPAGVTGVYSIASGVDHRCARRTNGTVVCTGDNGRGQLGDGTTDARDGMVPVVGLHDVVRIAAGGSHSCAVDEGHSLFCWGWNDCGQIGDGTGNNRPAPVRIDILPGVEQVSAGATHTCAITSAGALWCWGSSLNGQIGIQATTLPTRIALPGAAIAVSAGYQNTCALLADHSLYCWGSNYHGELGVGSADWTQQHPVPELVSTCR